MLPCEAMCDLASVIRQAERKAVAPVQANTGEYSLDTQNQMGKESAQL